MLATVLPSNTFSTITVTGDATFQSSAYYGDNLFMNAGVSASINPNFRQYCATGGNTQWQMYKGGTAYANIYWRWLFNNDDFTLYHMLSGASTGLLAGDWSAKKLLLTHARIANHLEFTASGSSPSGIAGLFANVSGEIIAEDSAGNQTQLTSHVEDKDAPFTPDPDSTYAIVEVSGARQKRNIINVVGAIRWIEQQSSQQFIYSEPLAPDKKYSRFTLRMDDFKPADVGSLSTRMDTIMQGVQP